MRYNRMFLDAIIDELADRYDSAYQKLNRCIALNPNAAEAYYFLATLDTTSRGDSLRIERLSQAVKLSPRNDIYQERLAKPISMQGNMTRVSRFMSSFQSAMPTEPTSYRCCFSSTTSRKIMTKCCKRSIELSRLRGQVRT